MTEASVCWEGTPDPRLSHNPAPSPSPPPALGPSHQPSLLCLLGAGSERKGKGTVTSPCDSPGLATQASWLWRTDGGAVSGTAQPPCHLSAGR